MPAFCCAVNSDIFKMKVKTFEITVDNLEISGYNGCNSY